MNTAPRKAVATVEPRPAATILVLRDSTEGLQVLMVKRSPQASFMPGAYVFPGGAVDGGDAAPDTLAACDESSTQLAARIGSVTQVGPQAAAFAVAGLRECFEECGLWLGAGPGHQPSTAWPTLRAQLLAGAPLARVARAAAAPLSTRVLQPWAHWVTPVGLGKRFATLFFVAPAPAGQVPTVDAGETTTLAWVHPPHALAAQARGEFQMEFATVSTVQSLQPWSAGPVQALLDHAATLASLPPLHPRLQVDAQLQIHGVLLPGQPGYEQAYRG